MTPKRSVIGEVPWALVGIVIIVALLGVYNLHSAAHSKDPDLFLKQLTWLGIGLGLAAAFAIPDYRTTESVAYVAFIAVLALLVAVLVQGYSAGGARRWLVVGGVRFQPSELAKIATILCLARYFSKRIPSEGYSLRRLFEPLFISRPLVLLAALFAGWQSEYLADPLGSVARMMAAEQGNAADVVVGATEVSWLKFGLLGSIFLAAGASLGLLYQIDKTRARLEPLSAIVKRNWILGTSAIALVLIAALIWVWNAVWLNQPGETLVRFMVAETSTGGLWAEAQSVFWLRGTLCFLLLGYLLLSVKHFFEQRDDFLDRLLAPIDVLLLPFLLILVEPDLGTSGIVFLVGMSMILVVGIRRISLVWLGLQGIAVAAIGWLAVLKDYQKRRILTFLNPDQDIHGAGWNAYQSLIAVGSGQLRGKGHRGGTQTQLSFLPEQHTDFAFSVWAEETGFIGCVILLVLYMAIILWALSIASDARDVYGALLAVGVAALIFWQAAINVGMVIGMLPVVGLTLPLFSYGGTSYLTVMAALGLLWSVAARQKIGTAAS